ncbi:MAG: DoxX family protein [Novosphingobium sp.]
MLLALFFAFVGGNKAFAPLEDLARYHAWTVYLPVWLGRAIGWSEIALSAGLLCILAPGLRRHARTAALLLIANQLAAALVHLTHGEASALPQNAVLIALLAFLAQSQMETA